MRLRESESDAIPICNGNRMYLVEHRDLLNFIPQNPFVSTVSGAKSFLIKLDIGNYQNSWEDKAVFCMVHILANVLM